MGRSKLAAVESQIFNILVHAVKAAAAPGTDRVPHWLDEMGVFPQAALRAFAPSMRQRLDLPMIWRRAARQAERSLRRFGATPPPLPVACPFTLDELLDDAVEPEALVARLLPPAVG